MVEIVRDIIDEVLDDVTNADLLRTMSAKSSYEDTEYKLNCVNISEDVTIDSVEKIFEKLYAENFELSTGNITEESGDILNLTPGCLVEELFEEIFLENWPL